MEMWQKILIYIAIGLVIRLIIAGMRGGRDTESSFAPRGNDAVRHSEASRPYRTAFLSDPAQMIERSLVFMACLEDRGKLDTVGGIQARHFGDGDGSSVQKTGRFAEQVFQLERMNADGFRTLLLSAIMNNRYRAQNPTDPVDTTTANIAFGLAVLSQNKLLDTKEEEAWRLLLLSKAKEIYPTFDAAQAALDRYYRAVLKDLHQRQSWKAPEGAASDYQRELLANAEAAKKAAARLEKQIAALSKLTSDPDWRRHMNKSWDRFQPIRLAEITKVERSK